MAWTFYPTSYEIDKNTATWQRLTVALSDFYSSEERSPFFTTKTSSNNATNGFSYSSFQYGNNTAFYSVQIGTGIATASVSYYTDSSIDGNGLTDWYVSTQGDGDQNSFSILTYFAGYETTTRTFEYSYQPTIIETLTSSIYISDFYDETTYENLTLDTNQSSRAGTLTYLKINSVFLYDISIKNYTEYGIFQKTGQYDQNSSTIDLVGIFSSEKNSGNIITKTDNLLLENESSTYSRSKFVVTPYSTTEYQSSASTITLTYDIVSSSVVVSTTITSRSDGPSGYPCIFDTFTDTFNYTSSYLQTSTQTYLLSTSGFTYNYNSLTDDPSVSDVRNWVYSYTTPDVILTTKSFISYLNYSVTHDIVYPREIVSTTSSFARAFFTTEFEFPNETVVLPPSAVVGSFLKLISIGSESAIFTQNALFGNYIKNISDTIAYWTVNSEAKAALTSYSAFANRLSVNYPDSAPVFYVFANRTTTISEDRINSLITNAVIGQEVSSNSSATSIYQTLNWQSGTGNTSSTRSFQIQYGGSNGIRVYSNDEINDYDTFVGANISFCPIASISPLQILNTVGQKYSASYTYDGYYYKLNSSILAFLTQSSTNAPISIETSGAIQDMKYTNGSILEVLSQSPEYALHTTQKSLQMYQ